MIYQKLILRQGIARVSIKEMRYFEWFMKFLYNPRVCFMKIDILATFWNLRKEINNKSEDQVFLMFSILSNDFSYLCGNLILEDLLVFTTEPSVNIYQK